MTIYNSALKNGTKQFEGYPPTQRFEHEGCIGMRRNIITEGYFAELETCDIIYCEPPFPAGVKVFDERAKKRHHLITILPTSLQCFGKDFHTNQDWLLLTSG